MDFKSMARVLRRRWKTIGATFLLALIASGVFSATSARQYQSTARIYISADNSQGQASNAQATYFLTERVKSYADLASHRELMKRVINKLKLNLTPDELAGKITAVAQPDTVIIAITVTDGDPEMAQRIAAQEATEFTAYLEEIETPKHSNQPQIKPTVTDPATLNLNPVSPRTALNLAVAGLLGLLMGTAIVIVRDVLDNTVKSAEELEDVLSAPVMASIGTDGAMNKRPLLTDLQGFSPRGEAFRMLRTNLQFLDLDSKPKSLVITSAMANEGKTTTSTNLAIALAQAGRRVLLVDGDLRRPRAAALLGLESNIGLTTVLVGRTSLEESIQRHVPSGVYFLASGPTPPNPSEILQSKATHELLRKLRDQFDAVIIDAPPLLAVADAAILSTAADGAILVTRYAKTQVEQLRTAQQRLEHVGGRLFGAVVNMIPKRQAESYYYYYEAYEASSARAEADAV